MAISTIILRSIFTPYIITHSTFQRFIMYAFYTGTSCRTGKEFYSANPFGESAEYEELTIEQVDLYKGQQFIYLFDFGDMWEFKIQVIDCIENEEAAPEIIEVKGESPQQYSY